MTDSNIHDKIRKLLNLARNQGATEGEASNAMTMATALMAKYRIDQSAFDKQETKTSIGHSHIDGDWHMWVSRAASAAGHLCACDVSFRVRASDITQVNFYGPNLDRQMAIDMFEYLINEVEKAYKRDLPKGMTKAARSEYRRTYKFACATRLWGRATEIVNTMKRDEQAAKAIGSRALVVAQSFDQQLSDIQDWMKERGMKFKESKSHGPKWGSGTVAGLAAGDAIHINKKVGG